MMSKIPSGTRIAVEIETVEALVEEQFPAFSGLGVRPVEHSGWDNHTFRLGSSHKVRFPASSVYLSQTHKETTWLPRLAPHLPFAIPSPVAVGRPGHGYPFEWSIWGWLEGEPATLEAIADLPAFAEDVAKFLEALSRCSTEGGPIPGPDNFFRAGDLSVYDEQVQACLRQLQGIVDTASLGTLWEDAKSSKWLDEPVWVHGDIAWGNLLVKDGRLHAVIDFGSSAVGDPACDLVINWTLFNDLARQRFRRCFRADEGMWARARGWCLWKSMLVLVENPGNDEIFSQERAVLAAVLDDASASPTL